MQLHALSPASSGSVWLRANAPSRVYSQLSRGGAEEGGGLVRGAEGWVGVVGEEGWGVQGAEGSAGATEWGGGEGSGDGGGGGAC